MTRTSSNTPIQRRSTDPADVVNIAAYKFVALNDLPARRRYLRRLCHELELKGTVLLSPEGINLFVAGSRAAVDALINDLQQDPLTSGLSIKESFSATQPFHRMLVKIKPEIIAFGVAGIDSVKHEARRLPVTELRQWLDEGRPIVLLDVRNDYELRLGTFRHAVGLGIDHFRQFPQALKRLPEEYKHQPVVTFCTGGVRCEKAAPLLQREGYRHVYQLDGGILKYFQECGGAHYDGECFVFDQRVALDSHLQETSTVQCFACQAPLTAADQQSPHYVTGKSCPHCFRTSDDQLTAVLARRHAQLQQYHDIRPGCAPYDNRRPIFISAKHEGQSLLDVLANLFPFVDRQDWRQRIADGLLTLAGQPVSPQQIVTAGEIFENLFPAVTEPDVSADICVLYEDSAIVVVYKPAPLPTHPCGRYNRNTLIYMLNEVYRPQRLRPAHRLDANTSGVTVLSRTRHIARKLQPEFDRGKVDKQYVARVQGHPPVDEFVCEAPISSAVSRAGSRTVAEDGLPARTQCVVDRRFADGTSLIKVTPITGRTNQIRLHLYDAGYPIVGDPMYHVDGEITPRQTLSTCEPPMCLHAWQLEFCHPISGQPVRFVADLPSWTAGTA